MSVAANHTADDSPDHEHKALLQRCAIGLARAGHHLDANGLAGPVLSRRRSRLPGQTRLLAS